MYRVIRDFKDKDTKQIYRTGEEYPSDGKVTKTRLNELLSSKNMIGVPLIEEIVEMVQGETI